MPMGENRFSFSMRVRSRISEMCQCMGIINTLSKLQILIFIIRIGNVLINSLYGAMETFVSWFEMALCAHSDISCQRS